MLELTRTNDLVFISWLCATLAGEGVRVTILDTHMSVLEGSASAIMRRIMVDDIDITTARRVLALGEKISLGLLDA